MKTGVSQSFAGNIFYERTSSWIRSYRNPEALDWIVKFVENSQESAEVKQALYKEIDYKKARLLQVEVYAKTKDGVFLMQDGQIAEYSTRFGAICKLATLALKGLNVELYPINGQYRILLNDVHLLNDVTGTITTKPLYNVKK